MVTVYLASYRGGARGLSRLVGAAVRWVTRSEWSHCEIALGDAFAGAVPCVSASGMDGGVRVKTMRLDPSRWSLTPLPWVAPARAVGFLEAYGGAGYDWLGVARFAVPILVRSEHPRRWFCSEACAAIMGLDDPWRFTPADLEVMARAAVGARLE